MRARIILFLALIVFLRLRDKQNARVKEVSEIPDQAIEKFTITETQSGKTHWIIERRTAKIFEDQKKAYLTAPVIRFFDKGSYASTITAEKGTVDMNTYDVIGEGTYATYHTKGESLDTSNLSILSQAQKIVTDENVKLVKKDSIVYGKGMEATPDLSI